MTYFFTKIEADNPVDGKKDGIHYASASSLEGPWSALTPERLPGMWRDSEGPSPVWTGEECILYYDASDGLGAVRSRDLETWEDATHLLTPPEAFKHGTVARVRWQR